MFCSYCSLYGISNCTCSRTSAYHSQINLFHIVLELPYTFGYKIICNMTALEYNTVGICVDLQAHTTSNRKELIEVIKMSTRFSCSTKLFDRWENSSTSLCTIFIILRVTISSTSVHTLLRLWGISPFDLVLIQIHKNVKKPLKSLSLIWTCIFVGFQ